MPDETQSQSKLTTDHETIQKWIEERKGIPAAVSSTKGKNEIGILRIMFPETAKNVANLEEISWEDFFRKFDESNLQFLYQDKTKDGKLSRFFKFVKKK